MGLKGLSQQSKLPNKRSKQTGSNPFGGQCNENEWEGSARVSTLSRLLKVPEGNFGTLQSNLRPANGKDRAVGQPVGPFEGIVMRGRAFLGQYLGHYKEKQYKAMG